MDAGQWLTAVGSLVVVSSGVIFFGYGIYRERLKAAREREQQMLSALARQSDSIDKLATIVDRGFQRLREDRLKEEIEELRRRQH